MHKTITVTDNDLVDRVINDSLSGFTLLGDKCRWSSNLHQAMMNRFKGMMNRLINAGVLHPQQAGHYIYRMRHVKAHPIKIADQFMAFGMDIWWRKQHARSIVWQHSLEKRFPQLASDFDATVFDGRFDTDFMHIG